jgi:hypothetical protein
VLNSAVVREDDKVILHNVTWCYTASMVLKGTKKPKLSSWFAGVISKTFLHPSCEYSRGGLGAFSYIVNLICQCKSTIESMGEREKLR